MIAKEFVKLMHGEINVESKIGLGSKFYFTAKMKLQQNVSIDQHLYTSAKVTSGQTHTGDGIITRHIQDKSESVQRKKLLLVEDNPISQNLELKILREVGYEVEAVSTGHAAIEAINTGVYSLALMDVEMTDMDGITATKKIRESSGANSKIPIIAVTAHSSMKDREKCLAAGMDDYIAKPINIHFLKITIDQWLNIPPRV
jgi:CheY-like chemotaxis protein